MLTQNSTIISREGWLSRHSLFGAYSKKNKQAWPPIRISRNEPIFVLLVTFLTKLCTNLVVQLKDSHVTREGFDKWVMCYYEDFLTLVSAIWRAAHKFRVKNVYGNTALLDSIFNVHLWFNRTASVPNVLSIFQMRLRTLFNFYDQIGRAFLDLQLLRGITRYLHTT